MRATLEGPAMTWRERLEALQDWLLLGWLAAVEVAQWLSDISALYPPVSWVIHAALAVPLAAISPWCPLAVFGYREAEQAAHAHILNGEPVTPAITVDRLMDVLAPAVVGLWLG